MVGRSLTNNSCTVRSQISPHDTWKQRRASLQLKAMSELQTICSPDKTRGECSVSLCFPTLEAELLMTGSCLERRGEGQLCISILMETPHYRFRDYNFYQQVLRMRQNENYISYRHNSSRERSKN